MSKKLQEAYPGTSSPFGIETLEMQVVATTNGEELKGVPESAGAAIMANVTTCFQFSGSTTRKCR